MAIVFPASPTLNDTFTEGSITYKCVQVNPNKWIGLGVTPGDRLVEGSNKLEINASNNLVWTGGDIGISKTDPVQWGGGVPTIEMKGTVSTGGNSTRSGAIAFESGSGNSGYAALWGQEGGIHIYTSATDRANTTYSSKFHSDGNLHFAAGKGIDFSANANAAGMSSELLDDYEEGIWTPSWGSTTGSFTSVTYDIQSGRYTKIGNRVFIDCRLRSSATVIGTAGGALLVTGLPFTCTTSQGTGGAASYSGFDFSNSGLFFGTETRENTSQFYAALGTRDNGAFFNDGPGSLQGSGNSEIRVQFCYKTDD